MSRYRCDCGDTECPSCGIAQGTRQGCQSCQALMINGVFCHEHGCPDAWRDYPAECRICGNEFRPENQAARVCPDCGAEALGDDCDAEPGDVLAESYRERPEYFEPEAPEDMAADLDDALEARAAACDHAAELGAEDMTHDGDAEAAADARGLDGRARMAYLDAWTDAKREGDSNA